MTTSTLNQLYITGIVVHFEESSRTVKKGWQASLQWQDIKFSELGSVKGEISTHSYEVSLSDAIETVLTMAENFKINNNADLNLPIGLYYKCDGKDKRIPPVNNEWNYTVKLLQKEAFKRDWISY